MKLTVPRIFKFFLLVLLGSIFLFVLLGVFDNLLPPNRLTHECKRDPQVSRLSGDFYSPDYKQGFCSEDYHVELKTSLENALGAPAAIGIFVSFFVLIPTGCVLLLRQLAGHK